jgi:hypothetical protein
MANSAELGDTHSAAGRAELVAKIGTILSAIMASSCCWLPPLLLIAGVSGAGIVATLEQYRPLFMVVTFSFLAMAFYFTYRRRPGMAAHNCCAPAEGRRRFNMMAVNKIMLWAVTAMAVVFLFFPQFVTGLFASSGGEFTADMRVADVHVNGMTCEG